MTKLLNRERRELSVWSIAMLAALGLAWWASQPASESDATTVKVASLDEKAVTEIKLRGQDQVELVGQRRDDGRWWITFTRQEKREGQEPTQVTERFVATEKIKEILAGFSPLVAQRDLGDVGEQRMTEFGLTDAAETLTLMGGSGELLRLRVGKTSWGSRNRFAQLGDEKRVLLLNGDGISDLSKAHVRLFERNLLGTMTDEITKAEVIQGQKSKVFEHTQRDQSGALLWTSEGGEPNASYKSWFDKVERLRLLTYATDEQVSDLGGLKGEFLVRFFKGETVVDELEFFRQGSAGTEVWWVKSKFLGTWVKLADNRAGPLQKDLAQILN